MLRRLADSPRDRIATLLRREGMTAGELSSKLRVTTNAVREQLVVMERDGVIHRTGLRRGITRPAHVYGLTAAAEQLLSQAYVPFLTQLVNVVTDAIPARQVEAVMRQTGKALAALVSPPKRPRSLRSRVAFASHLINAHLGAVTRVEENGAFVIRGAGCPLGALTSTHPAVCLALESLLSGLIGARVRESCDRSGRPRCRFHVDRT
jgi:predicted ArsR family transcriptional regulator